MNIEKFKSDFLARQQSSGQKQRQISIQYGVQQATLSRFIAGDSGLSFGNICKLWPFVYGCDFPSIPTAPATAPSSEEVGGDAA